MDNFVREEMQRKAWRLTSFSAWEKSDGRKVTGKLLGKERRKAKVDRRSGTFGKQRKQADVVCYAECVGER